MNDRSPRIDLDEARHKVLIFPDTYTNYNDPAPGKAAVRVLESLGCHVDIAPTVDSSGRAPYSKGFLDDAREIAAHNIEELAPWVDRGWSVVFLEPSDVAMFHDEYFSLLDHETVRPIAAETYEIFEFLNTYDLIQSDEETVDHRVTFHGHCNQKALNEAHHAPAVLEQYGFTVDVLDSGCCGMAGSFGYETEHFELSRAIGSILVDQISESTGETVVAPGVSCRTQLSDSSITSPIEHPIITLADVVTDP
jgi:Fe-S oxidoreductase